MKKLGRTRLVISDQDGTPLNSKERFRKVTSDQDGAAELFEMVHNLRMSRIP